MVIDHRKVAKSPLHSRANISNVDPGQQWLILTATTSMLLLWRVELFLQGLFIILVSQDVTMGKDHRAAALVLAANSGRSRGYPKVEARLV